MPAHLLRRSALPLAFILLVAGAWATSACSGSSSGSNSNPGSGSGSGSGSAQTLTAPGDSLALADSARRACGALDDDSKGRCYSGILDPLVTRHGLRVAMGTLNRLGMMDLYVHTDGGHDLAHGIGITAGKAGGDLSQTFASCTEIFQSGCYHGVIQAYFERVRTVNASEANAMCAPWTSPTSDQWLRFQCVHGMGHGLMMFYAHDLPQALESCDLLHDNWDRESCYGGAFMENIVHATAPHHSPAASLRVGPADAQHEQGGAAATRSSRPAFKPIDPGDMQYPCSVVAERYWNQCYHMQTSVMLHHNNGDIASTARLCQQAPGAMRYVCHKSLGRDISAYAHGDASDAVEMCSFADPEYQPWCHVGVVANFIDFTAKATVGIAYCREVPGDRNKALCYETVGDEIAALRVAKADREALCGKVEAAWREVCRYGAQLQPVRPPLIPEPRGG